MIKIISFCVLLKLQKYYFRNEKNSIYKILLLEIILNSSIKRPADGGIDII